MSVHEARSARLSSPFPALSSPGGGYSPLFRGREGLRKGVVGALAPAQPVGMLTQPAPIMQCTLGGFEELQSMKAEKRTMLGLPPLPEDSIKVVRNMRAASPPASASDLIEQQQKRGRREHKVRATGPCSSQGSLHTVAWSLD